MIIVLFLFLFLILFLLVDLFYCGVSLKSKREVVGRADSLILKKANPKMGSLPVGFIGVSPAGWMFSKLIAFDDYYFIVEVDGSEVFVPVDKRIYRSHKEGDYIFISLIKETFKFKIPFLEFGMNFKRNKEEFILKGEVFPRSLKWKKL